MRTLLLILFGLFILESCSENEKSTLEEIENITLPEVESIPVAVRLNDRTRNLRQFISGNDTYNKEIAFLIDLKVKSSQKRFFVYDLKADSVLDTGMVSHGAGSDQGSGELTFSNVEGSRSSSLGKYAIDYSYNGQFGKAYKLAGLDSTNSNAFVRNVVLHSFGAVPDEEQQYPICLSNGCPMVSIAFFNKLEEYIDSSPKKILLEVYY